jgi:hypothetical protein
MPSNLAHRPQILHSFTIHSTAPPIFGKLLVDSGAESDFISEALVKKFAIHTELLPTSESITLANGKQIGVSFFTNVTMTVGSEPPLRLSRSLIVAPISHDIILGTFPL